MLERLQGLDLAVVAAYLAAVVGMSLVFAWRQRTGQDYFLAGRAMGGTTLAFSILANQASAVSLVGAPAFVALRPGGGLRWLQYELAAGHAPPLRLPASRAALGPGLFDLCLCLLLAGLLRVDPQFASLMEGRPADSLVPVFMMKYLPEGLRGLLLAAILAAAMSSIDSALNSLAAVTLDDVMGLDPARQSVWLGAVHFPRLGALRRGLRRNLRAQRSRDPGAGESSGVGFLRTGAGDLCSGSAGARRERAGSAHRTRRGPRL